MVAWILILVAAVALAMDGTPLYKQRGAPIDERVQDLLSRMTLDEKVNQLIQLWVHSNNSGNRLLEMLPLTSRLHQENIRKHRGGSLVLVLGFKRWSVWF